jgi:hypothetical protein
MRVGPGANAQGVCPDKEKQVWLLFDFRKPGPPGQVRDDRLCLRSTLFFGFRCRVSGVRKMSNHGCPKYSRMSIPRVNRPLRKPVAELKSAT